MRVCWQGAGPSLWASFDSLTLEDSEGRCIDLLNEVWSNPHADNEDKQVRQSASLLVCVQHHVHSSCHCQSRLSLASVLVSE